MERYHITDLIKIGLRRFFWVFIPFAIIMIVALGILGAVPAKYHSKALLIVEDQQISEDLVPSAIQARAEDRLATIRASLRSRENIIELSDRFDLIDRESDVPFSERVDAVRDAIRIDISRINDARSRRREGPSTITFQIGYVHEEPQTAFRVANQLVTDFLTENIEARIEAAEDSATFMRDEERNLRRQLTDVQNQIAEVRRQNPGISPETVGYNEENIRRLNDQITAVEERIAAENQQLRLLRMQQPLMMQASERTDLERSELREKRRILSTAKRRYTDNHPDVITLTMEILDLEERLEPAAFMDRATQTVRAINERLEAENLRLGEARDLRERRNDLEQRIVTVEQLGGDQNLAELQFRSNEQAILQRIANYDQRLVDLRESVAQAETRLEATPAVIAQLSGLASEEGRLQRQLNQTQQARATAERSENMEEQQKAERVRILDPPVLPDVPTSPDKPRVAMLITALAGGAAAVIGIAPVFLAPRVDSRRQLTQVVPGLPIIEVPEIVDAEERKFRRNVFVGLIALSAFLTLVLAAVAYLVLLR